ncbi:hypothetical protein ACIOHC_36415 [Streptomyces sp. NPDC088252]|uniref:hypothetical protein n=1 Tax=Streptomyces sp. NPDC088252 TaxID=3365845 RepID=UPI0038004CC9
MTLIRHDPPIPIEEGLRLGEDDDYLYEMWPQLFNDRLVLRVKKIPTTWRYGWCFKQANGLAVVAAFAVWDPETEDEPIGWHKRPGREVRKAPQRDTKPDYNQPRCVHGDYMSMACLRDPFCPRKREAS